MRHAGILGRGFVVLLAATFGSAVHAEDQSALLCRLLLEQARIDRRPRARGAAGRVAAMTTGRDAQWTKRSVPIVRRIAIYAA